MSYELGWVKRIKVPKGADMLLGDALHKTMATFHKMKMDQEILERKDLAELFVETFDRIASAELVNWKESKPDDLRNMGIALVEAYYPAALAVQPLAVEEQFYTEFPVDGEMIRIIGVIDIIDITSLPYDLKTANKLAKKITTMNVLQPCFYAICLGAKELDRFMFHNLVRANIPFFKPTPVTIAEEHVTWVKDVAIPLWVRQIRSGIFPPSISGCDWCDYKVAKACKGFL